MLSEQVDLKTLSQKVSSEVTCRVDELIMKPIRRYHKVLPDDIQAKIDNDLHSPVIQFIPLFIIMFRNKEVRHKWL